MKKKYLIDWNMGSLLYKEEYRGEERRQRKGTRWGRGKSELEVSELRPH